MREKKQEKKKSTTQRLTVKQRNFINEYIKLGNATQAAIKAGYSKNTAAETGYENLNKPHIKIEIEKRLKKIEDAKIAKADEVLKFLTSVLRGEITEEEVVVERQGDYSNARLITKQASIRDRLRSAEMLARRYALFTERLELTTPKSNEAIDSLLGSISSREVEGE